MLHTLLWKAFSASKMHYYFEDKNMIDVLDMDGKPLMPTQRHDKVRHLLKERKAKVVKKNRVLRKHRFIH